MPFGGDVFTTPGAVVVVVKTCVSALRAFHKGFLAVSVSATAKAMGRDSSGLARPLQGLPGQFVAALVLGMPLMPPDPLPTD